MTKCLSSVLKLPWGVLRRGHPTAGGATVSTSTNQITTTVHYPLCCYQGTRRYSEATTSLEACGKSRSATEPPAVNELR